MNGTTDSPEQSFALGGPERKEGFTFDWAQWQSMKIEKADENSFFATLHYEPDYPPDTKEALKIKQQMPFEVMLRLDNSLLQTISQTYELDEQTDSKKKTEEPAVFKFRNERVNNIKRTVVQDRFFRESLKHIMARADLSFFWHGWASDSRVWLDWQEGILKKNILNRSRKGKPVVNIIPCGMGVKGGCLTQEINGRQCFTPKDYGQQMANFINLFGAWDRKIDLFGHSMGGIGALWAALKIVEDSRFRTSQGQMPDLRLWLAAPAYPAEANIFIKNYLELLLGFLKATPGFARGVGNPVAIWINQSLLQECPNFLHQIHSQIAIDNPHQVVQTLFGLKYQPSFTPEQWQRIIQNFPITIVGHPQDRLVDYQLSFGAFDRLTEQARALVEERAKEQDLFCPLILLENLVGAADHYIQSLRGEKGEVKTEKGKREISLPLSALPQLLTLVPRQNWQPVLARLDSYFRRMKEEALVEREGKEFKRAQNIVREATRQAVLQEREEVELLNLLCSILEYHRLTADLGY